jgi:hypothetical protein
VDDRLDNAILDIRGKPEMTSGPAWFREAMEKEFYRAKTGMLKHKTDWITHPMWQQRSADIYASLSDCANRWIIYLDGQYRANKEAYLDGQAGQS